MLQGGLVIFGQHGTGSGVTGVADETATIYAFVNHCRLLPKRESVNQHSMRKL